MRIKRFNESEQVDISKDRVDEILTELQKTFDSIEEQNKFIDELDIELNKYKSDSQKGNDQIDDAIFSLQVVKKNLTDSMDKISGVVDNLTNYNDEGRKYLYTETK